MRTDRSPYDIDVDQIRRDAEALRSETLRTWVLDIGKRFRSSR